MTALGLFVVQDGGPYGRSGDFMSAGDQASLMYQPLNMRVRGLSSTPTHRRRGLRSVAPGGVQVVATLMAPMMHKAAKQLGIDRSR